MCQGDAQGVYGISQKVGETAAAALGLPSGGGQAAYAGGMGGGGGGASAPTAEAAAAGQLAAALRNLYGGVGSHVEDASLSLVLARREGAAGAGKGSRAAVARC